MNTTFLILVSFFIFSISVSVNCNASQGRNVLDMDDVETLSVKDCHDMNVCMLNCNSFFPHCRSKTFFDMTPLYHSPIYEDRQAYAHVCILRHFTDNNIKVPEVQRLVIELLAPYLGMHVAHIHHAIFSSVEFFWAGNFERFLLHFVHDPIKKEVARAFWNYGYALRAFQSTCENLYSMGYHHQFHTLFLKIEEFERDFQRRLVHSRPSDFLTNPGLNAFRSENDWALHPWFHGNLFKSQQYSPLKHTARWRFIHEIIARRVNGFCECNDFHRYIGWIRGENPTNLFHAYGIHRHIIDARFHGFFFAMRNKCQSIC